jgi:carboxyl-terminal processing protease
MLRGDEGTTVDITVYRESTKETKNITLTRAIVELKYVKYRMLKDGIGYLRLTQFSEEVYSDIVDALKDLKNQGMKALVFDLRNNPGGSLEESIKITSLFIKNGNVVSVRDKKGNERFYERVGEYLGDFPMVVLINEGSASASEIVSGALKDYERAILLGEKSFGKGSVQSLIPLPDGDGIKLTIAKYYTPSGVSIHKKGIEPNIVVEESDDFLFFNGFITNIDEEETKENREKAIEELKGEEEAEKLKEKKDVQLETAQSVLKGILLHQGKK